MKAIMPMTRNTCVAVAVTLTTIAMKLPTTAEANEKALSALNVENAKSHFEPVHRRTTSLEIRCLYACGMASVREKPFQRLTQT